MNGTVLALIQLLLLVYFCWYLQTRPESCEIPKFMWVGLGIGVLLLLIRALFVQMGWV